MNGTSRCLILRLLVGPTLICRPLQLTTPDKLLSLPITIPLLRLPTLVGSLEHLEIGEKWSCSSIPSMTETIGDRKPSQTTDHLWDVSFSDAHNGTAVGEGGR